MFYIIMFVIKRFSGTGLSGGGWVVAAVFIFSISQLLSGEGYLISKGPYLQAPGSNTMTIMWESPVNLPAKVYYGTNEFVEVQLRGGKKCSSSLGGIFSSTNYYIYQATLKGLQPDTTYFYYAQIGGTKTEVKKFRTFPSKIDRVRFIVYGDTRSNPGVHRDIALNFKSFSPDFILHTGDLVSKGSRYEVWGREFFSPLSNVIDEIPLFPVLGNHEEKSDNYFNYFVLPDKKNYYAFEAGPVFILGLDYHYQKQSDEQYKFAARALESTKAPWKIVMVHIPMFNLGGHFSGWGHKYYLPLFHRTGVDVVIAGHSHIYERFYPIAPAGSPGSAITHITSGGGGAPLATSLSHPALAAHWRTNHFLYFEVTSSNLIGKCFNLRRQELDSFEIKKVDGRYDSEYLGRVYSEEKARLSLEAITNLVARAANLPSATKPALVMFKIFPLMTVSGVAQMELSLTAESAKFYTIVGGDTVVSTPPEGGKEKVVWVKVAPKAGVTVRERGNRELNPPLVFQAVVKSGGVEATAVGKAAYISNTAIKEAKAVNIID
ncbi:MAG: metallophosphoesterase, partial [Limisphaerales bacterium]